LDLAELQAQSGKIDAAVSLADGAVSNSRGALGVRLRLVRLLFQQGDLKRAEGELALLRKEFTPNAPVLSAMGGLALLKRDGGAAKGYFEQALKLDPNDLDAVSGLVAVDLMNGQPESARKRAEAALAKSPKSLDYVLLSAKTYGASGDLPKAEGMLHRAIDLDPANPEAYGMLGQLMYTQGRLEDGRKEFEKIATEQPKNVAALTMLAIIAGRQGNDDEAIRRYEQILAIDREAVYAANNLAFLYVQQNRQLDRAIELATMAQKRLPDEPSVADTLGWAYVKKNVALVGLRFLKTAVDKAPTNAGFRYHLGAAYAQLKDKPNAVAELEQAFKLDPKFDGADDARQLLESLKKTF
jgi:tetratricopeptide (TPR) repeat protein